MQPVPALPWEEGYGGSVRLKEPVTIEQLKEGAVIFAISSNGQQEDDVRVTYTDDDLFVSAGPETIFGLALDSTRKVLLLTYINEDDTYSLTGVSLA